MPFPFPQPDSGTRWRLWFKRGLTGHAKHMDLHAAGIPACAERRIDELVRAARFADLPAEPPEVPFDADEYRLAAWRGDRHHEVHWTNRSATPALTELFRTLETLGTWIPE